ncbi:hypothetical protein HGP14_34750 [Rhizobium sp. P32RR-XVIII]|uniref:hypothetical protein n=1 Tax=Rhizobium sp. P32RR-XVIII TaxID=2726738 RepID=UPI0014566300|nr:hypothetical protein [Rhizobium sp. P32RR-XVIII]NLS08340.1 hypothetical protein [Rhizobium sp. P32RR-XVIII]
MIQTRISSDQIPMQDEDVAMCQRVFDQVCEAKHVTSGEARDELATQIIHFYQHGVRDEDILRRLMGGP